MPEFLSFFQGKMPEEWQIEIDRIVLNLQKYTVFDLTLLFKRYTLYRTNERMFYAGTIL